MTFEECRICGSDVLYSESVHATIHTRDDEGVVDFYVCTSCYRDELAPLFSGREEADAA